MARTSLQKIPAGIHQSGIQNTAQEQIEQIAGILKESLQDNLPENKKERLCYLFVAILLSAIFLTLLFYSQKPH
jgi:predicted component of type VI protein secretion system